MARHSPLAAAIGFVALFTNGAAEARGGHCGDSCFETVKVVVLLGYLVGLPAIACSTWSTERHPSWGSLLFLGGVVGVSALVAAAWAAQKLGVEPHPWALLAPGAVGIVITAPNWRVLMEGWRKGRRRRRSRGHSARRR